MYLSGKAQKLIPYKAGEQPNEEFIKLNTNENPYPPPPKLKEELISASQNLQLYPKPNADLLRSAIAKHHHLKEENVFCANGSDEALALCYLAFFDDEVTTYDVSYSFYPVWAGLFSNTLKQIPLLEDFYPNVLAMKGHKNVLIANPNAPTGIALKEEDLEEIIASTKGACVIDEAYIDFGGVSAVKFIPKYKNLVVVRTMSKYNSLAGMRIGYVMGDAGLIAGLNTVKDSFNSYPLDTLAQRAGVFAIENDVYFMQNAKQIISTRQYTINALNGMGIEVLPSSTNFIFAKFDNAKEVFSKLYAKKILVRHFEMPRISDFLRITIGTRQQMEIFTEGIKEICK